MNIPKTFLTESKHVDTTSILKILTQNKNANVNNSDKQYVALAEWANDGHIQQQTKNISLNTLNISDRSLIQEGKLGSTFKDLGSLLTALKDLMDKQGGYDKTNKLSNKIQKITLEILVSLKKGTKLEKNEETEETKSKLYEGMDWTAEKARRLANAKDPSAVLDKFYNDYYNIEYAGGTEGTAGDLSIVAKLKSLDKILIPEFNALGYNPEVNPLAQFLKILIGLRAKDKTANIFDKLNTNNYGAIHNSFKNSYITGNMLGNYNDLNILFCGDLYNHRGLDMVQYISLWREVYNKTKGDSTEKSIFAAKIIINQPRAVGETYAKKANSLKELQSNEVITPSSDEAKLRSIPEIQELYRYIFKAEITKDENSTKLIKKEVNPEAIIDIVNEAVTQNGVLDMLKLISEQKAYRAKYPENAQKIANWLEKRNYTYSQANINDSEKILQDYALTVSALNLIVKALIKHIDKQSGADK
jgi:hypothetical protein